MARKLTPEQRRRRRDPNNVPLRKLLKRWRDTPELIEALCRSRPHGEWFRAGGLMLMGTGDFSRWQAMGAPAQRLPGTVKPLTMAEIRRVVSALKANEVKPIDAVRRLGYRHLDPIVQLTGP